MPAAPSFDYHRPETLDAALALLAELGAGARVLAGGTDLVDKLRRSAVTTDHLVSITRIQGLRDVRFDEAGGLTIGAAARIRDVGRHPDVGRRYPALARACSVMATTHIRNMGTVAGNVANGSPCADTAGPLLVHGATLTIAHRGGRRQVDLDRFFLGPKQVDLGPGELIVELRVPVPPARSGSAYERISARSAVDMAAAGVAGFVELDAGGAVRTARLALGAVAPTPMRAAEAEGLLAGRPPDADAIAAAAAACAKACCPIDDVRATAAWRRAVVEVMARRVLHRAAKRARGDAS